MKAFKFRKLIPKWITEPPFPSGYAIIPISSWEALESDPKQFEEILELFAKGYMVHIIPERKSTKCTRCCTRCMPCGMQQANQSATSKAKASNCRDQFLTALDNALTDLIENRDSSNSEDKYRGAQTP